MTVLPVFVLLIPVAVSDFVRALKLQRALW